MALTDRARLAAVAPRGGPLGAADLPELSALHAAAYPGNWFDSRMLDTGQYVGVRCGGRLVAVARADNVAAVRLYERLGFTPVAEYGEFGMTARVPG